MDDVSNNENFFIDGSRYPEGWEQNDDGSIRFNPLQTDLADPTDEYIAQKIMGLVPCPDWNYMNFGSAGGACLGKACKHENGTCYPSVTTGNFHGKVGGCPMYSTIPNCSKELIEHLRNQSIEIFVSYQKDKVKGAVYTIGGAMAMETEATAELAIAKAAVSFHKQTVYEKML